MNDVEGKEEGEDSPKYLQSNRGLKTNNISIYGDLKREKPLCVCQVMLLHYLTIVFLVLDMSRKRHTPLCRKFDTNEDSLGFAYSTKKSKYKYFSFIRKRNCIF